MLHCLIYFTLLLLLPQLIFLFAILKASECSPEAHIQYQLSNRNSYVLTLNKQTILKQINLHIILRRYVALGRYIKKLILSIYWTFIRTIFQTHEILSQVLNRNVKLTILWFDGELLSKYWQILVVFFLYIILKSLLKNISCST